MTVAQPNPNAQVARGQDIGPIERENQEHLGGPHADALDGGQRLGDRLIIPGIVEFIERDLPDWRPPRPG